MITKHCTKCNSNDIDELLWINQTTGEVSAREDQFYCNYCRAKVNVTMVEDSIGWVTDITPLEESNITPDT